MEKKRAPMKRRLQAFLRKHLDDLLLAAGWGLIVGGVALLSIPVAMIVGGVMCLALAVLIEMGGRK
jgi:hypothetical protein